jgi:hypothetical protein
MSNPAAVIPRMSPSGVLDFLSPVSAEVAEVAEVALSAVAVETPDGVMNVPSTLTRKSEDKRGRLL